MTKTVLHIAIFTLLACSCSSKKESKAAKNEIEIGEYVFQFPQDFKLIKEKGIDSHVGRASNEKIDFQFDYGYYSNSLDKSIDEYLTEDVWKWNALRRNNLLPEGDVTGKTKEMELIDYVTSDSIKYTLLFLYKSDTIKYDLNIPDEMRNVKIEIDTVDHVVYKFVRKEDYVGLYAKNLKSFNNSINSCKSLSITSDKLSHEETEKCYKILRSCKLKNEYP